MRMSGVVGQKWRTSGYHFETQLALGSDGKAS